MTSNRIFHVPTAINLGSGKDFRPDFFNIDIDDSWTPDAVLDLSTTVLDEHGIVLGCDRFGATALMPGTVDKIIANDVVEHVSNLVAMMTTCLGLLKIGGVFEISTPYDLSFGAWQDPTHVRSFNERSWLYYTDWFWYLGWRDARFTVDKLDFVLSPIGLALHEAGISRDDIARTPRAVDSMSVTLRKIALTAGDLTTLAHWRDRRAAAKNNTRSVSAPAPAASPMPAFAGGWQNDKDRFCLWTVTVEAYSHNQAIDEVALGLSEAFAALGGSAPVVRHPSEWSGRIPIILGAHLLAPLPNLELPTGSVLFNLEQVDLSSSWMGGAYLDMLKRHAVLDYSAANVAALRRLGLTHVRHLPIGYAPALTRIPHAKIQDIDVLFVGALNPRRAAILDALRAAGLAVVHLFDVYGPARDEAIGRAKIVLNLHFYEAAVFEIVRVSYLLANRMCVVSEGEDEEDTAPYQGGLRLCRYDEIVANCVALVADAAARGALAARGFELITARTQADLLEAAFAA